MIRRVLLLLGTGLVLNTTGCAVLSVLALPFELLFSLVGDGLGAVVDAVVYAEMIDGPAPVVERVEQNAFVLRGIDPRARFEVVCTAPGHEARRFRWPDDLSGLEAEDGARVEVVCWLERRDDGG